MSLLLNGNSGSIAIDVSGGIPPYTYSCKVGRSSPVLLRTFQGSPYLVIIV
ncbi:MAG: SprB repeat-containing protein [Lewinellaceae bacterium]|nr:SprB repeat-containing protein [Lewinellaceae bacterium]